ncbi:hypothetical protein SLA2020_040020 [Shorea laevis]
MFLTRPDVIEAAELYGPSALSQAEMDKLMSAAEGLVVPKKPRKKSRTSTAASEGAEVKRPASSTSARAPEV